MRKFARGGKGTLSGKERRWAAALDTVITEGLACADFKILLATRWMKLPHPRLRENTIASLVEAPNIQSIDFWRLEADRSLNGAVLSVMVVCGTPLWRGSKPFGRNWTPTRLRRVWNI